MLAWNWGCGCCSLRATVPQLFSHLPPLLGEILPRIHTSPLQHTSKSSSCGALVAGIGVEGTLIYTRGSINSCFYGRSLPAWQLLTEDSVAPPAAARPLYAALEEVLAKVELPLSVAEASRWATCFEVQHDVITGSKLPFHASSLSRLGLQPAFQSKMEGWPPWPGTQTCPNGMACSTPMSVDYSNFPLCCALSPWTAD